MQPGGAEPITRVRRTQQQRREGTRNRLLDATVECLVELGYSGTTTLEIERRAGVSRGARIHHYPTKASILAGACDYLYLQLSDHYDAAFGGAPGEADADRVRNGLRLLWSVYRQRSYAAALELHMAARTDEELRARLLELGDVHRRLAVDAAVRHFAVGEELAVRLVEATHAVLLGLLMTSNVDPDEQRQLQVLELLESMVIAHLPDTTKHSAHSA